MHALNGLLQLLASSGSGLLHEVPTGVSWGYGHLNGAGGCAPKKPHYRASKVVLAMGGGPQPLFPWTSPHNYLTLGHGD